MRARASAVPPALAGYRGSIGPLRLARFWALFLLESCTSRRLSRAVRLRLHGERPLHVAGSAHLPATGTFVLAANHFGGRGALDTIAAILAAANAGRSDFADRYLLIVGRRPRPSTGLPLPARLVRRGIERLMDRWSAHLVRIPLGNEHASVAFLREWRRRTRTQPALVFPEGRSRTALGAMRPGSGRWLAALGTPVLPVGVWWYRDRWYVRFGAPLAWSHRPELRDLQIGLAIAVLLPQELVGAWEGRLGCWRAAHA